MTPTAETLVPEQLGQAIQPLLPTLPSATAADPASMAARRCPADVCGGWLPVVVGTWSRAVHVTDQGGETHYRCIRLGAPLRHGCAAQLT